MIIIVMQMEFELFVHYFCSDGQLLRNGGIEPIMKRLSSMYL